MPTSGFSAFARFAELTAALPPPESGGPVEPLSGAVYEFDCIRRSVAWSRELESLIGERLDHEVTKEPGWWLQRVHEQDRVRVQSAWSCSAAETPGDFIDLEYRVLHASGEHRWVWERARVVREGGQIVRRLGCILSVHARKCVELTLARERERMDMAQSAGGVGLWDWDAATDVTYWSDAMFAMYGLPRTAGNVVPPGVWMSLIEADDAQRLEGEVERFLRSGEREYRSEFRLRRRADGPTWIETVARVERDARGSPVRMYGINIDVTARRLAQQRAAGALDAMRLANEGLESVVAERTSELRSTYDKLRLSERMATIGTLTAGLGHDLGNLLLPLRVRLESLAKHIGGGPGSKDVEDIRQAMNYLARLTRGLRMFSMDAGANAPRGRGDATDVTAWMSDVEPFFRVVLPAGISLKCHVEGGVGSARIAPHQLTQAVYNLVQNAGEALRGGGRGQVEVCAAREDDRVVVSVRDDGPGMPPEIAQRCLEAFFSTKPQQTHGGMGLALVRQITSGVGGRVELSTGAGQGATFRLLLPTGPVPATANGPRAVVCVEDPRTASLVASMLRRMQVVVESGNAGPDGALDLLVASGTSGARRAKEFLESRPKGVAMVIGSSEPARTDGLVVIPAEGGMSALQEALNSVVRKLQADHARI